VRIVCDGVGGWTRIRGTTCLAALALVLAAASSRAVAAQSAAPDARAAASQEPAQRAHIGPAAQAVLDRAITALGGQAFLDYKTLSSHGRLFSLAGSNEAFVYYDSEVQFPDKRRLAYGMSKKGRPIIIINNGDQGWEVDRMGQVHLDTSDIKQWRFANRYSLENLLRITIHQPGVLVQSAGSDFVNNVNVHILDIFDSRHTQVKLYVNKQTSLPVEIWYRRWNVNINDWDEFADVYADYRTTQNVATPMHITRTVNGERVSEVYRSTVTYNESYPAALFADPGIGH
jgi:hypothetical protein